MPRNELGRRSGFTIIELVVVCGLLAIIMLFSFPALQNLIHRNRLESAARNVSVLMQTARFAAIKNSVEVPVTIDTTTGVATAYLDRDKDRTQDSGEATVGSEGGVPLGKGLTFVGPPGDAAALTGFDSNTYALFLPDGGVEDLGAVRIADDRGNYLELKVAPAATGRIELRKWDGSVWRTQGESGAWTFN